jgi:hypothetical protein
MNRPDYGLSPRPESVDRVAGKEKMTQMPFAQCPVCGGEKEIYGPVSRPYHG